MTVPFAKAYGPNVALVVLTLFPGLINAGAMEMLGTGIGGSLHAAPKLVAAIPVIADGAFAFGILLAAECVRRLNLRPLYLILLAADAVALVTAATSSSIAAFGASYIVQGLLGGMFLIVALPPLFVNFSEAKFPVSGAVLVPGLFGATMLGPMIAGWLDSMHVWRLLFWGDAVVIAAALALATLTVGARKPPAAQTPVDFVALGMGAVATTLIFFGAINLSTHDWTYPAASVPFALGVVALAGMLVCKRFLSKPLIPIREMLTALPVIGLLAAAAGNAIFIADQRIFALLLTDVAGRTPLQAGLALWPELLSSLAAGIAFALAVKTRLLPRMIVSGLVLSLAGSVLLLIGVAFPAPLLGAATAGMLCFRLGSGLTVTPGLFLAGLSVEQQLVARGIAAVELLRLTFGFVTAPGAQHTMLIHGGSEKALAAFVESGRTVGIARAAAVHDLLVGMRWTLAYVIAGCVVAVALAAFMLRIYYARPERPDLRAYVRDGKPAFTSPPLQT